MSPTELRISYSPGRGGWTIAAGGEVGPIIYCRWRDALSAALGIRGYRRLVVHRVDGSLSGVLRLDHAETGVAELSRIEMAPRDHAGQEVSGQVAGPPLRARSAVSPPLHPTNPLSGDGQPGRAL